MLFSLWALNHDTMNRQAGLQTHVHIQDTKVLAHTSAVQSFTQIYTHGHTVTSINLFHDSNSMTTVI